MSVDDPIPYVLVDAELPVPYVPVGYDCRVNNTQDTECG